MQHRACVPLCLRLAVYIYKEPFVYLTEVLLRASGDKGIRASLLEWTDYAHFQVLICTLCLHCDMFAGFYDQKAIFLKMPELQHLFTPSA